MQRPLTCRDMNRKPNFTKGSDTEFPQKLIISDNLFTGLCNRGIGPARTDRSSFMISIPCGSFVRRWALNLTWWTLMCYKCSHLRFQDFSLAGKAEQKQSRIILNGYYPAKRSRRPEAYTLQLGHRTWCYISGVKNHSSCLLRLYQLRSAFAVHFASIPREAAAG